MPTQTVTPSETFPLYALKNAREALVILGLPCPSRRAFDLFFKEEKDGPRNTKKMYSPKYSMRKIEKFLDSEESKILIILYHKAKEKEAFLLCDEIFKLFKNLLENAQK